MCWSSVLCHSSKHTLDLAVLQEHKHGQSHISCKALVALRKEVWIMISSPSTGRKEIHFPGFPDGLCGDCGREARQAVDGHSAGLAAEFTDLLYATGCSGGITVNNRGAHCSPLTLTSKVLRTAEHAHVPSTCSSAARHAEDRSAFQLFLTIWMRNVHGHLVSL